MFQEIYERRVPVFDHDTVLKHEKVMFISLMFLEHDQTRRTSVSYDFSNSWANGRGAFLFIIVRLTIHMIV